MIGELFIDSLDAFTHYGVSLAKGAFSGVVEYAPLKAPKSNDWHEYNGIEVDLTAPRLDTRSFSIPFICEDIALLGGLFDLISGAGYHSFTFAGLNKTFNLRLVSQPSLYTIQSMQSFVLEFADDFPLDGFTYVAPSKSGISDGFKLDNKDFSLYGIRVLEGTKDEILKSPSVKQNKQVNIKSHTGAIYDASEVVFDSKDVSLFLFMQASNIDEFWKNYNGFLFDLIRVGERNLTVSSTNYPCYYKSAKVKDMTIFPDGRVWCEFDITMVFTR